MKNILTVLVLLMTSSICFAANTYSFFATGTATAGSSASVTITTPDGGPYVSSGVLFVNDGTNEVYVDFTGQLTEAQITAETRAIRLKGSEYFSDDEFKTSKIKVRGNGGSSAYRFWALF